MTVITVTDSVANEALYSELVRIDGKTRRAVRQSWFAFGKDLKKTANRQILDKKSKSGKIYWIKPKRSKSGRRRKHQASAPGETHANRYGDLRRLIGWKVRGFESMDFGYGVSPHRNLKALKYARFVELGTRFMDPRPSLFNAIEHEQSSMGQHFIRRMDEEFNQ